MKILAISDVREWSHEPLLRKYRPDVVALAGDLVNDGFASVGSRAYELIPEFKRAKKKLIAVFVREARQLPELRQKPKAFIEAMTGSIFQLPHQEETIRVVKQLRQTFEQAVEDLREPHRGTATHNAARWKLHVSKFYEFLKIAGRISTVLVVRSDHDDDYSDDYLPDKINALPGCMEISGKVQSVDGVCFLGLGYNECHYRTKLTQLLRTPRPDVVIAHAPQRNMDLVAKFSSHVLIRGHFGFGRYLVGDNPAVFTAGTHHALIELQANGSIAIRLFNKRGSKYEEMTRSSCRPWFTNTSEFERYSWLKPFEAQNASAAGVV